MKLFSQISTTLLQICLIFSLFIIPSESALLKTYPCSDVGHKLLAVRMPRVEAYYDRYNTNLLSYRMRANLKRGNITDIDEETNKFTTLHVQMSYIDGSEVNQYFRFCNHLGTYSDPTVYPDFSKLSLNSTFENLCPLTANDFFDINFVQELIDPKGLSSFTIRFSIISNNAESDLLGCAEAYITPQFSIAYNVVLNISLPVLLVVIAIIHIYGLLGSPYQESNSNAFLNLVSAICNESYLRHLSPSVPDLLQYAQFAFFNAGLNLCYPGWYQPLLSNMNWCALMTYNFLRSVLTPKDMEANNLYLAYYDDGLDGLTLFSSEQLKSYGWTSFMLWSLVILGIVLLINEVIVVASWIRQKRSPVVDHEFSQDFHKRNLFYMLGAILYVYYSLFSLPFLVLSLYQFYHQGSSQFRSILGFVLVIIWVIGIVTFLLKYVFGIENLIRLVKRKSRFARGFAPNPSTISKKLYTSVNLINLFGFVYYKLKPNKLRFIFYEYLLLFIKAVGISCLQRSGVAQVVLMICVELTYFFLLLVYKPYYVGAKKNLNALIIAFFKVLVVFLNIPYLYKLNVSERIRSCIGYAQIAVHALLVVVIILRSFSTVLDITMSRHRFKNKSYFEQTDSPVANTNELTYERLLTSNLMEKQTNNVLNHTSRSSYSLGNSLDLEKCLLSSSSDSPYNSNYNSNSNANNSNNNLKNNLSSMTRSLKSESAFEGSVDTSAFFRQPQTLLLSPELQTPTAAYDSSTSNSINRDRRVELELTSSSMNLDGFDINRKASYDPLLSTTYQPKKNVDYSVREADLYRGIVPEPEEEILKIWNKRDGNLNSINPMTSNGAEPLNDDGKFSSPFITNVSKLFKKMLTKERPTPIESGFHVSRPKQLVVKNANEVRQLQMTTNSDYDDDYDDGGERVINDNYRYTSPSYTNDLGMDRLQRISRQNSLVSKKTTPDAVEPRLIDLNSPVAANNFDSMIGGIYNSAGTSISNSTNSSKCNSRASSYHALAQKTRDNYHDTIHEVPEELSRESTYKKARRYTNNSEVDLGYKGIPSEEIFEFESLVRKDTDYYSLND